MCQKNSPLHKIIIASQNRPPWIRKDPDSPIWPRSALDTSQIMPLSGGPRSFCRVTIVVTMTRCGHKIVAPTQSGSREKIAACYRRIAKINHSHFWIYIHLQDTWPASCKYRNRYSIYNNNFKIKHFQAEEDMNLNEFADFGSKKYIWYIKPIDHYKKLNTFNSRRVRI